MLGSTRTRARVAAPFYIDAPVERLAAYPRDGGVAIEAGSAIPPRSLADEHHRPEPVIEMSMSIHDGVDLVGDAGRGEGVDG
jgi:hypothetical protein